jgi:hypothetical protein
MDKAAVDTAVSALESTIHTIDFWALICGIGVAIFLAGEIWFIGAHWLKEHTLRPLRERQAQLTELEITNAKKATEELQNENLRLREAVLPRILEQIAVKQALDKFRGTKAFLTSVPDFEARDFMKFLGVTLQMAEWEVTFMPSRDDLFDGVTIEYSAGPERQPDGSIVEYNAPLRAAVDALIAELTKQDIKAAPGRWGAHHVIEGMPRDAMQIRVGMKPLPDFVRDKMLKGRRPAMYRSGPAVKLPP